jgi:hypothetical protein
MAERSFQVTDPLAAPAWAAGDGVRRGAAARPRTAAFGPTRLAGQAVRAR